MLSLVVATALAKGDNEWQGFDGDGFSDDGDGMIVRRRGAPKY